MYNLILVPLDGSATAERGLREALALAKHLGARVVLLHVIDNYPAFVEHASAAAFEQSTALLRRQGMDLLAQAAALAAEHGVSATQEQLEAVGERAAPVILDQAVKQGCDLIVMGTHGRRGMSRMMMGSDAELVLRCSPVPVLTVRAP